MKITNASNVIRITVKIKIHLLKITILNIEVGKFQD